MACWYKQPVQYRRGPPIKARKPEPSLHWRLHVRFITSTRNWMCSSARPGRSQQLEIPPSLNSKQAACFSSSTGFSTNTGFLPGAGISTPARILLSAWFSASARISQSAGFSLVARISQSAWFSLAASVFNSAWFSLAARICTYFQYFIFLHSLWSMRQYWLAQLFQAFRFKIIYCNNGYILCFMIIIINIVLTL